MNKLLDALLRNADKQAEALSKRWGKRSKPVKRSVFLTIFIWSCILCFLSLMFVVWYGFFFFLILAGITGHLYDRL